MGCWRRGLQTSRRVCQANGYTPRMDPTLDMWYAADTGANVVGGKVAALQEITGRNFAALANASNIAAATWLPLNVSSRTAFSFTDSTDGAPSVHCVSSASTPGVILGTPCTLDIELSATSANQWYRIDLPPTRAYFNCYSGAIGTVTGGGTTTIQASDNGFFRCRITTVLDTLTGFIQLNTTSGDGGVVYTGSSSRSLTFRSMSVTQQGQLIQTTGGNRGTLKTDARYGGRTVLDMTGNIYMTGNPPGRDQPYTYYIVGNVLDTTTLHYLFGSTGGAVSLAQLSANGGVSLSAGTALTAPGNASTPGIYVATTNGVSSAVNVRSLTATASGNAGAGALKTGALYLGSSATPSLYNGDAWGQLIGCRSATVNPRIVQYLARYYGFTLS